MIRQDFSKIWYIHPKTVDIYRIDVYTPNGTELARYL